MDIWGSIKKLEGQTLATLDRRQEFKIVQVLPNLIIIETSTGNPRNISMHELQESWSSLEEIGQISRSDIMKFYSPFNPAYVAAILSNFPGISYRIRPIVLRSIRR